MSVKSNNCFLGTNHHTFITRLAASRNKLYILPTMYVCQLYPAIIKIQLKPKQFNQSGFFTILFMPVTS
jgi:hypothetical protein